MPKHTLVALAVLAAACGSSGPAAQPPAGPTPSSATSAAEARAGCVKLRERQRACTDAFIPALVDLRITHDVPPGIAARARADGRDAIVAQAFEEWRRDSTDQSIAAMCDRMPMPPGVTPAQRAAVAKCLTEAECQAFVGCFLPVLGEIMTAGPPR